MKKLWKHIRGCKDKNCPVKYCAYSRDSLTHYHRCCDMWCPVCLPVRGAIHRAHAKARAEKEKIATRENGEDAEQEEKQQANTDDSAAEQEEEGSFAEEVKKGFEELNEKIKEKLSDPIHARARLRQG